MRGGGARLNLLLVAVVAVAVAAVALVREGNGTAAPTGLTGSARAAATAFATAYLRYLDGRLPVTSLPDASPAVRRIAKGIVIPRRSRFGSLTLAGSSVTGLARSSAQAGFVGRDRRHAYPAQISLSDRSGRWEIVNLVPPDLYVILAPRVRPSPAPPAARAAAEKFALAYADYREGVLQGRPPAGLPLVRTQIADAKDPLARARPTHASARLLGLRFGPVGDDTVDATAVLSDHGSRVTLTFIMKQRDSRWQAWWLISGTGG